MKIYDISVPIHPQMPVWPGDPGVKIEQASSIEAGDNANVSRLSFGAHTGTHVDAPYHFVQDGVTLGRVPLDVFVGQAEVIEILDVPLITAADLKKAGTHPQTSRLLIKTVNSEIWKRGENRFQEDFVALSQDAAQYLVDRGIQLVGIDYLSIAPFKQSRPTHEIFLGAGVAILEGINLVDVPPGRYHLTCLPLKLDIDGAPSRAILTEIEL